MLNINVHIFTIWKVNCLNRNINNTDVVKLLPCNQFSTALVFSSVYSRIWQPLFHVERWGCSFVVLCDMLDSRATNIHGTRTQFVHQCQGFDRACPP